MPAIQFLAQLLIAGWPPSSGSAISPERAAGRTSRETSSVPSQGCAAHVNCHFTRDSWPLPPFPFAPEETVKNVLTGVKGERVLREI
eukprot:CAMPEP_0170648500 /NCGR_PEP_ID=MMETSP0224-20130122/44769_1 /TAXON_ID=285029 /ORGANISM="Togula jolla, Strain CCCM 725" /LENGTH=86 /DNA_ID=CAMNT_0010980033 /DNA_START=72 /DNA_END=332 /DNA_ORIENTATION=-